MRGLRLGRYRERCGGQGSRRCVGSTRSMLMPILAGSRQSLQGGGKTCRGLRRLACR